MLGADGSDDDSQAQVKADGGADETEPPSDEGRRRFQFAPAV
jgi:hypothetical protein